MKLKIVSNGTVEGTRIFNMDTGARLEDVRAVDIRMRDGEPVTAIVAIGPIEVETVAEGTIDEPNQYKLELADDTTTNVPQF